jgi:hypothetical protein
MICSGSNWTSRTKVSSEEVLAKNPTNIEDQLCKSLSYLAENLLPPVQWMDSSNFGTTATKPVSLNLETLINNTVVSRGLPIPMNLAPIS